MVLSSQGAGLCLWPDKPNDEGGTIGLAAKVLGKW